MYFRWFGDKLWTFVPAQVIVGQFIQTFKEFPPRQKPEGAGIDEALKVLQSAPGQ